MKVNVDWLPLAPLDCYQRIIIIYAGGRSRRGKMRGSPGSKDLVTALKGCDDPLFLDFMRRCMEWDPSARMTPSQALRHAWLRRRLPKNQHGDDATQTVGKRASATMAALSKLQSGGSSKTRQIGPISEDVKFNTRTKLPQIGSTM